VLLNNFNFLNTQLEGVGESSINKSSATAQTAEIKFTPNAPGFVTCKARNIHGSDKAVGQLMLGDLPQSFFLTGIDDDHKIAEGDQLKLECGAAIYNHSSEIKWYKDGEPIENFPHLDVADTSTKYSYRRSIIWESITKDDEGIYECEVYHKNDSETGDVEEHNIQKEQEQVVIKVHTPILPLITSNFNQSVIRQPLGEALRLECFVGGLPTPNLIWYKDDELFVVSENNSNRISMDSKNETIYFTVLTMDDAGKYKCDGRNRIGSDHRSVEIEVLGELSLQSFKLTRD